MCFIIEINMRIIDESIEIENFPRFIFNKKCFSKFIL
jgi:hypothetical protein